MEFGSRVPGSGKHVAQLGTSGFPRVPMELRQIMHVPKASARNLRERPINNHGGDTSPKKRILGFRLG